MRAPPIPSQIRELTLPSGRPLLLVSEALRGSRYGGNKARKFEGILREAKRRDVGRLVSVGAIGSHHVVATAIFAREAGLAARCYVVPQPDVPSAHRNARAALAAGAELVPVQTQAEAALRMAWALHEQDSLVVPVGGSSVAGSEPYVEAASELAPFAERIRTLVVALGSGGTAAGLMAGIARRDLPIRVHAVATSGPMPLVYAMTRSMLARLLRSTPVKLAGAQRRIRLLDTELGAGYALPTTASARALRVAAEMGLVLDPVYTAKAFAHVLALDERGVEGLAFWHTVSAVDLSWLDPLPALPPALLRLFRDVARVPSGEPH